MRTTLNIDDDVLAVARALARRKGISLGGAISELARRGIRRGAEAGEERALGVFGVGPNARPITNEDVFKALEDFP